MLYGNGDDRIRTLWHGQISLQSQLLAPKAVEILRDYEKQKKSGKNPVFDPAKFGIKDETGAWNRKKIVDLVSAIFLVMNRFRNFLCI